MKKESWIWRLYVKFDMWLEAPICKPKIKGMGAVKYLRITDDIN
jgi:hypothetical protein